MEKENLCSDITENQCTATDKPEQTISALSKQIVVLLKQNTNLKNEKAELERKISDLQTQVKQLQTYQEVLLGLVGKSTQGYKPKQNPKPITTTMYAIAMDDFTWTQSNNIDVSNNPTSIQDSVDTGAIASAYAIVMDGLNTVAHNIGIADGQSKPDVSGSNPTAPSGTRYGIAFR